MQYKQNTKPLHPKSVGGMYTRGSKQIISHLCNLDDLKISMLYNCQSAKAKYFPITFKGKQAGLGTAKYIHQSYSNGYTISTTYGRDYYENCRRVHHTQLSGAGSFPIWQWIANKVSSAMEGNLQQPLAHWSIKSIISEFLQPQKNMSNTSFE